MVPQQVRLWLTSFPCRLTDFENTLWLTKGKGGGGINWEFGINIYTLLYLKRMTNTAQGTLLNIL